MTASGVFNDPYGALGDLTESLGVADEPVRTDGGLGGFG